MITITINGKQVTAPIWQLEELLDHLENQRHKPTKKARPNTGIIITLKRLFSKY